MENLSTNLPTHQLLPEILKSCSRKTLCTDVPKLFSSRYFLDDYPKCYALLPKPVSFNSIMFACWCKLRGESLSQDKRTRIVFVDAYMHLDTFRCGQYNSSTNLFHHCSSGNEISSTGSKCYDLYMYSAGGNFSLELTLPKHRASSNIDNISRPASNTDDVAVRLVLKRYSW